MKVYLLQYNPPYSEDSENMEIFSSEELAEKYIQAFVTSPDTFSTYSRTRRYYTIVEFNLIEE